MGAYIRYQKILVRQIQYRISEVNRKRKEKNIEFNEVLQGYKVSFWRNKVKMLAPEYMSRFYEEINELEKNWKIDYESKQSEN